MRRLQTTCLFLTVLLATSAAAADDPATRPLGPRVASAAETRGLLAWPAPGYAQPVMCAGGQRVVSSEAHFYSFPLFMAGLGGILAAPLVGMSFGFPIHAAHPQDDTALFVGFTSSVLVLAAGISLAVVGGHRVTREVYAVSSLRLQPGPGGLALRF